MSYLDYVYRDNLTTFCINACFFRLQTWEVIQEDKDGLIEFSVQDMLERAKRKRLLEKSGAKIKLGMMRHLYIILDLSDAMKLQVG